MANTAKKPTPKTQKQAPEKTAAQGAAPKLMAVTDTPKPAGKGSAKPSAKKAPTAKGTGARVTTKTQPLDPSKLTDEDILRMPESDYMNEVQLAFFKAKLLAMRAEILNNARETGEHLKENEVFADPNDRATVEEENMLEQRVRDRERKLLKKIDQALARIESGQYGYCLETGEPIGIPRLLARPTAELSIEAQEKHERMERLYAD